MGISFQVVMIVGFFPEVLGKLLPYCTYLKNCDKSCFYSVILCHNVNGDRIGQSFSSNIVAFMWRC